MTFGPWLALAEAAARAPETPGVFETRAPTLFDLPRGRSAMVLYGASPDGVGLRAHLASQAGRAALARAAGAGATYIRFASADAPAQALAKRLGQFIARFGAPPLAQDP